MSGGTLLLGVVPSAILYRTGRSRLDAIAFASPASCSSSSSSHGSWPSRCGIGSSSEDGKQVRRCFALVPTPALCDKNEVLFRMLAMKEDTMTPLTKALACRQCVVSVMGDHAGEGVDAIFNRKKADIRRTGITFWLMRSPKARPDHVQHICTSAPAYTIFVEPATKGGARPTTQEDAAKEYSADGVRWHRLPNGLSPVTGKLDNGATALVFDLMTTDVSGTFDLWDYVELSDTNKPLRFILGCSTVCAIRKDTKLLPEKMKSRYRGIIAIARLAHPFCVWVR